MKHLLISRLVILFFILIGCLTCKNKSESSPPEYDSNLCSEYSCPLHKDKMSVSLDVCPECGIQMVDADLMKSLLSRTVQSINDSINVYHNRIVNDSYIIMNADSISNNEINLYNKILFDDIIDKTYHTIIIIDLFSLYQEQDIKNITINGYM